MKNEETNHSLNNPDNYKTNIDCNVGVVAEKYANLIIEYYKFIYENVHLKNTNHSKYIIIRGLDTLTNVFLNLLSATKNIELTYFHCQKSFYFYVEFVGQISDDEKSFLQLTSRDATTYVYKKTVFEICQDHKKPNDAEHNEKCKKIGHLINTYQMYLLKLINANIKQNSDNNETIEKIASTCNKASSSANKINVSNLEYITEKIYNKIENCETFLNVSFEIIKKLTKPGNDATFIKSIEKKLDSDEFSNSQTNLEDFMFF